MAIKAYCNQRSSSGGWALASNCSSKGKNVFCRRQDGIFDWLVTDPNGIDLAGGGVPVVMEASNQSKAGIKEGCTLWRNRSVLVSVGSENARPQRSVARNYRG